ncbi:unnamed protein product, partial [Adineta steineri]
SPSPLTGTKSAPTNNENSSSKFPSRMPTWSKGCLRPHSPLRPNPTTILGTNSPNLSANNNTGDNISVNTTESG